MRRDHLHPSTAHQLDFGRDPIPFLLYLSGDVDLQVANDARVLLSLDFGDAEAIGVQVGIGVCRLGLGFRLRHRLIGFIQIHVCVQHGDDCVRLDACFCAFELDSLFGDVDGIDHGDQNIFSGVLVQLAAVLHDLNQLRLVLELVEQKDAAVFR